ncbi:MAG: DUF192 domain-containing protein [Proteobacteria bacterium]|nr:DUF192 domain-containing protein [Pseudomonadota bacterium]
MRIFTLLALLALLPWPAAAQQLPRTELSAGMYLIRAEVADNFVTRMQGLMHRPSMGANEGMLFVFDDADIQCMWMKNTLIPLSVAYLADDGSIVNVEDMKPQTEDSHCAKKPVRFALEMNLGWFASKGLKPGAKLRGLEKFKTPR